MMLQVWLLPVLILAAAVGLGLPLGRYLAWILDGRYTPWRWLGWLEQRVNTGPQNWKQYGLALLTFNTAAFAVGFAILALQPLLPLNPDNKGMLAPGTIFSTTCSFLTNTNLQHYAGEVHLSYFSQLFFICWKQFVTPSIGLAALLAVIRGLRGDAHLGNFYLDVWRGVAYVFLPLCLVTAVLLIAAGVPMTLEGAARAETVQEGAMGTEDGKSVLQILARGPVAAVVAIKQLGTNGGGFFGANAAHPFENPNAWSNFLICLAIILLPVASLFLFGRMLNNLRHALV